MEAGELTNDDVRSILARYSVGEFVGLTRLPFDAFNAPYYRIETTTGRYFLKRYKIFTENVDGGLDLIAFLRRRGYPVIEILLSRVGSPHVAYGGAEVALFEYAELPGGDGELPQAAPAHWVKVSERSMPLPHGFPLPNVFLGHDELLRRLRAIPLAPWMSDAARETLAFVTDAFPSLTVPADQPRGACHVDFELDHVRFAGDTILRVIDWDLVGADHLFYDLGTTMSETVRADGINFRSLAAIVAGYQKRRDLTDWERTHLYEATSYGTCKYLIWEYIPQRLEIHELSADSFKKVDALRALGKREFDARYESAARAD